MSLFKQIALIFSLFLFVVIASVMTLNFRSATNYAQEELYANAQNTTASLSLSLAKAKGNISTMSTMINAVFDSGYYKEIILVDMQGKELYSRAKDDTKSAVPSWFLNLYSLDVQSGSAHISAGWTPIGILEVSALEEGAHVKLFKIFNELLIAFVIILCVTSIILSFLLHFVLASLTRVREQAEAVGKNDFIINKTIPYTTELKEITLVMNKMVQKVQKIFEQESIAVKNYHKLLYTDTLTGFGNKKYFDLKLKTLIHAEDINANGVILSFYFGGIETANKILGRDGVDKLLQDFAKNIETAVENELHAMKVRFDASKFGIVFPTLHVKDINTITKTILSKALDKIS
ncbi:MAG TPA: diguanylate cyclase, partial [Sulfurimonas sp.]|nr:diguanylate cyclase [Sulfurimonas sp.]